MTLLKRVKLHSVWYILRRSNTHSVISKDSPIDTNAIAVNEPTLAYMKSSPERIALEKCLKRMAETCEDVPIVIGNEEIRSGKEMMQPMPHNHKQKIAKFYYADEGLIQKAIDVSVKAQREWDKVPNSVRFDLWDKIACMMKSQYRAELCASTMLGQSKTIIQAEIDAAVELIDFFNFNSASFKHGLAYQPISEDPKVTLNSWRFRGNDGFIASVTPFNFTAICGNLAYTPALAGNGVLWKPTDSAILSNWIIFKICREAGVPPGLVNFVPADGPTFGSTCVSSKWFAGLNFTGSSATFRLLWKQVGNNIDNYVNFPRIIGECGGKNYHFVHPSADVCSVITGTIRSSFEYCGQKCSACSRMYVPESLWKDISEGMVEIRNTLKIGDPCDATTFTSAVIDEKAFARIKMYIDHAKTSPDCKVLAGGTYDDSCGYYINPTIVQTMNPMDKLMQEEIFGPVVTAYVYKDGEEQQALDLLKSTSPYALTGSVFSQDMDFMKHALEDLRFTAGNIYLNDKSTGSVVGQQPFGGSHMSGTNDKAGGPHYILRFTNPQTIKETFVPLRDVLYPYMTEDIGNKC